MTTTDDERIGLVAIGRLDPDKRERLLAVDLNTSGTVAQLLEKYRGQPRLWLEALGYPATKGDRG